MSGGSSAGMSGAPPAGWPAPPRVALATVPSLTAAAQGNLLRAFAHDAEAIFKASEAQLLCVKGIGPATAAAIRNIDLAVFGARMAEWRSAGLRLLQAGDADYPSALQRLYPLPPMLFTRGEWLPPRQRVAVGVVGTRSPSRQALPLRRRNRRAPRGIGRAPRQRPGGGNRCRGALGGIARAG